MSRRTTPLFVAAAGLAASTGAQPVAPGLYLSVADNIGTEIVQGPYTDNEVIRTNPAGSFSESFFSIDSGDLDAFHILPNGNYLISSLFNGSLGGVTFGDADLIEYDPNTGVIIGNYLGLGEGSFTSSASDISAATTDDQGNLYFSALATTNTILHSGGSLTFTDGDIVRLDAATGVATIAVFEADLFDDGDGDVYGLHLDTNGTLLISANEDEMISGSMFLDGDVFRYDPLNDIASPFFSESSFTDGVNTHDIDAIYFAIPAPAAATLLGMASLTATRRRRA
ncbi:MAG: hypothetical protein ACTS22_07970 [Phycisphaerales bacterium]